MLTKSELAASLRLKQSIRNAYVGGTLEILPRPKGKKTQVRLYRNVNTGEVLYLNSKSVKRGSGWVKAGGLERWV